MKRRLVAMLSLASLILCAVSLVTWVRSWPCVVGTWDGSVVFCYAAGNDGDRFVNDDNSSVPLTPRAFFPKPPPSRPAVGAGRIDENLDNGSYHFNFYWLCLPGWFLALVFAFGPALWLLGSLKRRRATRMQRCAACGYDLRASPGRCPECGAASAGKVGETAPGPDQIF